MTAEPHPSWDASYSAAAPPPWDIGRPQPVFQQLAEQGLLAGRVLDAGCGTGEHTLLAAAHGADAVGVDISPSAIRRARAKAAERDLPASFEVADLLAPGDLGPPFDVAIDNGVFHVFGDDTRPLYVASLASLLRPGGNCYLMCFSDREPGTWGPRRVHREELAAAFTADWAAESITPAEFQVIVDGVPGTAQAWLAVLRRL